MQISTSMDGVPDDVLRLWFPEMHDGAVRQSARARQFARQSARRAASRAAIAAAAAGLASEGVCIDVPVFGRSGVQLATRRRWLVGGCAAWRAPVIRQMLADGELDAVPVGDTGFRLR